MMRIAAIVVSVLALSSAWATPLSREERAAVDAAARDIVADTGVPSLSIAIVRGGEIAYAQAYGYARTDRRTRATTETRYAIGSNSKQFTAASILLLQEVGLLSISDPVGRFIPDLTRGDDITLAQIMSHTSGYRDYWPQDYVFGQMGLPAPREAVLNGWARIPLDFEPGTELRYSNTGFTIAGLIVESLSGQALHDYQQEWLFAPLGMTGVSEIDTGPLPHPHAQGFTRVGLGPIVEAPKEGPGWLFAIGELAMRPTDLAIWNIALMNGAVLSDESRALMTTAQPVNGQPGRAGLGLFVRTNEQGRRVWNHGGAVSGFLSQNVVYPDEGLAITAFTNGDFTDAYEQAIARLSFLLREQPPRIALVRDTLAGLQRGEINRALFTANANGYFDEAMLLAYARGLRGLGAPQLITEQRAGLRGGFTTDIYTVTFADHTAQILVRAVPDGGPMEQFTISLGD